jgi:hypothetical protein|tara:strand:+ start:448 stop:693 length:246 start_codon:yes stop_codon:yes gene_type:complete
MNLKVEALRAKYEAQKLEAVATLEVYMKGAVGIGEHPQIIEEMDKLIKSVAEANDCLETLDIIFITADDGTSLSTSGSING